MQKQIVSNTKIKSYESSIMLKENLENKLHKVNKEASKIYIDAIKSESKAKGNEDAAENCYGNKEMADEINKLGNISVNNFVNEQHN